MKSIRIAETDADIEACFDVMQQLRPHLIPPDFVSRVRRQMRDGYTLAFLQSGGATCAVAGYRIIENLANGRVLYVDDLVTDAGRRSEGFGEMLFEWLVEQASEQNCATLELDSGVQRHGAHRFYLTHRMHISSYHFRLTVGEGSAGNRSG